MSIIWEQERVIGKGSPKLYFISALLPIVVGVSSQRRQKSKLRQKIWVLDKVLELEQTERA